MNRFSILSAAVVLMLAGTCYSRASKPHPLGSLTVDYNAPYEQMVQVVHDVANDGHILGTSMFAKDEDIPGAEIANKTTVFSKWSGNGTVTYKVRTGTLAPTHFIDSSDVGTLAVRYIVQPVDAGNSRVTIEAVFVEDGHRHRHLSDGSVETSELGSITQRIRTLQEQEREAEAAKRWSAEEHKIKELERTLKEAQSQADAAKIQVKQLQARVDEMRKATYARVKGENVELRSGPYSRAATIQSLAKGQEVKVLYRITYWCRVQLPQGQEGWVYQLFLEGAQ